MRTPLSLGRAQDYSTTPYPGEIPSVPFVIIDGTVHEVSFVGGRSVADGAPLSDVVAGLDLVPLLSYGSNSCPGRLWQKFEDVEAHGAVVLPGPLEGVQRAWSREPSRSGSVRVTLVAKPDAQVRAHVLLLPAAYGPAMDRSEGRSGPYYVLARLSGSRFVVDGGPTWRAPLAYVGHKNRGPAVVNGAAVTDLTLSQSRVLELIQSVDEVSGDSMLPEMLPVADVVSLGGARDWFYDGALRRYLGAPFEAA